MSDDAIRNRARIEEIKRLYAIGQIDREEAEKRAQPVIDAINKRGAEIAKKYKKSYAPVSFIGLMR